MYLDSAQNILPDLMLSRHDLENVYEPFITKQSDTVVNMNEHVVYFYENSALKSNISMCLVWDG